MSSFLTDFFDKPAQVENKFTAAVFIVAGAFSAAVLVWAPLIVGALVIDKGFTDSQAGYAISADMAGVALAAIPAMFWIHKINWRYVALFASALAMIANGTAAFIDLFPAFLSVRFICGLASGTMLAVCMASVALRKVPDRVYALIGMAQLGLGSIGFAILPGIIQTMGAQGIFLVIVFLMFALACLVCYLPTRGEAAVENQNGDEKQPIAIVGIIGITGILILYIGLSAVWAYLERIGAASGLSVQSIGYCLSLAALFGMGGALSAAFMGADFGRLIPTISGIIMICAGIILLLKTLTVFIFMMAVGLFAFAWSFILPFLLSAMAQIDISGRLVIISNATMGAGIAIGPSIAAIVLVESYSAINWLGFICVTISLLFLIPVMLASSAKTLVATKNQTAASASV